MTHRPQSKASPLTQERLRELLEYNPNDGEFRRIVAVSNTKVGAAAGTKDRKGYQIIRVDATMYRAHRLAFLYMIGRMPLAEVDHINGIKADNRWSNLREATAHVNAQNHRKARVDNALGTRGVCWKKQSQRYVAQISISGKRVCLGYFKSAGEASAAYEAARLVHHAGFVPDEVCA